MWSIYTGDPLYIWRKPIEIIKKKRKAFQGEIMKILDILFVVFELYNFVGLFKLRKSAKKEIKVIKEQKATEHMNEELIRMIKLRIQGLPDEVEKFSEQLKKGGYHFLMESDDYPNRNSEYVRRYVEVMLDEDQDQ